MTETPKYTIVNNNLQRVSPHRREISMFNTNNSLDIHTERSASSRNDQRSRSIHALQQHKQPDTDDAKLMIRYIMVCVELERMGRAHDKNKINRYNEEQSLKEFRSEFELLKSTVLSKNRQIGSLHQQISALNLKIKYFEQSLRQKQRLLDQKDQQIRTTRLELTGMSLSHSRFQHNQKNKIKQLQGQLLFQKGKYFDAVKRKDEMELQLLSLAKRENALSTSAAANERKLQALEEQTQNLRILRTRIEAQHNQSSSTAAALSRDKQQLSKRVEELRTKAERIDELQGRLQRLEIDHDNTAHAAQQAQTRVHVLETELAAANAELKAVRTGESENLRRHFANLENKIASLGGGLEEREQLNRAHELQQVTRQRDSLGMKVEQLISEVAKLERMLASRESACSNCARLTSENSLLSRKLGVLEQSLRERENELQRQTTRISVPVASDSGKGKLSVRDLLLSAQQLKGSNERMSRLIDSTEEYELKAVVKSGSQKILAYRQ